MERLGVDFIVVVLKQEERFVSKEIVNKKFELLPFSLIGVRCKS